MPSSSERRAIERHIKGLEQLLDLSQPVKLRERVMSNSAALGVMVASLVMKGGRRLDEKSSDALTEDYLDAIEDLPAWAVREAIRKWNRAESVPLDRKPHDFTWRPEPPTLARLARIERWAVSGRIVALKRLLSAVPMPEFSEEHRNEMLSRMSVLMHSVMDRITHQPHREAAE